MSSDKTQILPDARTTTVGTQLSGIYELDQRLGSGGMGEVYRGHNIQTGDHVAIKIVLPEYAHNQTILSLVRKEASILNRLSHDAIVRYHVFTVDPGIGRPYLAMEFVDGVSLLDLMRHGPMSTADVRKLCHRLASGLSAVHEAGAVHRDLSPDNIILPGGKVERAKIIDFGIARSATIGGETLIGGGFAGKYNYVSPEQLGLFGGDVKEASDIYSLGLVLAAAMRGEPLEMAGSQLEVVEKRRTVPALSGIDSEFRPLIEAMLQPDPADRPASMAEIAGMTRDDTIVTAPPRSLPPRQPDWTSAKTELSSPPRPSASPTSANLQGAATTAPTTSWSGVQEPDFVPYIPPAHLSQPRPATAPPTEAAPAGKPSNARNIALAAAAAVVVAVGAGAYLGGFLTPPERSAAADAVETPATTEKPAPPTAAPAAERVADAALADQPPKDITPSAPVAEVAVPATSQPSGIAEPDQAAPAVEQSAPTVEQIAAPAATEPAAPPPEDKPATSEAPLVAPVVTEQQQAIASVPDQPSEPTASGETDVAAAPPILPDSPSADTGRQEQPTEPAVDTVAAEKPAATNEARVPVVAQPVPGAAPPEAVVEQPAPVTVQPKPVVETPAPVVEPPKAVVEKPAPIDQQPATVAQPAAEPANPEKQVAAPAPSTPPAPEQDIASEATQPATVPKPEEAVVALNVPAPPAAASDAIDTVADRVSWLHDYRGGDCFYATVTSATDKAIEIEGFGTTVAPFEQMLEAFQAKFHVEPDVSVRLIEPAQCEITDFLQALGAATAKSPRLSLDRTSVPNGSAISGTLEARGGLRTSLLLIDNKGMAFSLDKHVVVQSGKAIFNVPISLGAVDQAAGKKVPQIIVAVTGDVDLKAAEFSNSTAATVALANILAEIRANGQQFSATAKYFQLGG